MIGDRLSVAQKLSYGVGHVLNDLTASMWFSYLIIYLHRVVIFQNYTSGYMMLLGIDLKLQLEPKPF
jgi:Na+/melibiose symporter-like transporter